MVEVGKRERRIVKLPPSPRSVRAIRIDLERRFPNLHHSTWQVRSPRTVDYNCFAWAACDTKKRWEPTVPPIHYWPPTVDRQMTLHGFVRAFATLGYRPCDSESFEFGFQKVAIYVVRGDDEIEPVHMARQHFLGRGWLSKLGDLEDILHVKLMDVESHEYGKVEQVLKRSWFAAARFGLFQCWWAAFKFWVLRLTGHYAI